MAQEVHTGEVLAGHVEIDGAFFGGHIRPENRKEDRKDRRLKRHQTGKRRVVIAMRERVGRTLPFVSKCSIPDDHIDPRRSALFMTRSILREVREGVGAC